MEPQGSLPCPQEPAPGSYPEPHESSPQVTPTNPSPRPCVAFFNMLGFNGEEFVAPRPTPKLEDHTLSAVRDGSSIYS
jgi:hypothetical protein